MAQLSAVTPDPDSSHVHLIIDSQFLGDQAVGLYKFKIKTIYRFDVSFVYELSLQIYGIKYIPPSVLK